MKELKTAIFSTLFLFVVSCSSDSSSAAKGPGVSNFGGTLILELDSQKLATELNPANRSLALQLTKNGNCYQWSAQLNGAIDTSGRLEDGEVRPTQAKGSLSVVQTKLGVALRPQGSAEKCRSLLPTRVAITGSLSELILKVRFPKLSELYGLEPVDPSFELPGDFYFFTGDLPLVSPLMSVTTNEIHGVVLTNSAINNIHDDYEYAKQTGMFEIKKKHYQIKAADAHVKIYHEQRLSPSRERIWVEVANLASQLFQFETTDQKQQFFNRVMKNAKAKELGGNND
ncbi:MAG: hypothetical protein IT289_07720 [Oligoflexia bacterium]|nr:hypothetical protein [Oligoflexia bacterium]